jgi:hypothetical protein
MVVSENAMKRALCIGINAYPGIPGNNLNGCLNDARNIGNALGTIFKFDQVKTLLDSKAARFDILDGRDWLCAGAKLGDELVFTYSGHGTQVADRNGDESDGLDEALCPSDLCASNWEKCPITDDELCSGFIKLPRGVHLTILADCCHSGSITREFARYNSRFLPPRFSRKFASRRHIHRLAQMPEAPWVCLSGCRDNETSADAFIDEQYAGALTHALLHVIAGDANKTWIDAHATLTHWLAREGYTQHPVLSGMPTELNRQMFGGTR